LLLCLAAAFFWARSYFTGDYAVVGHWDIGPTSATDRCLYVDTYEGGVALTARVQRDQYGADEGERIMRQAKSRWGFEFGSHRAVNAAANWLVHKGFWRRIGFALYRLDGGPNRYANVTVTVVDRRLCVPYWSLVLLFMAAPAPRLARMIRTRRRQARAAAGLCAACGYDLRASTGRCPECGAPAPVASTQ